MILIGVRGDGEEKKFLLQNWWREKQTVEVDESYLRACEATCWYVSTPQPKIPDHFTILNKTFYGETEEGVDKEDVCEEGI